MGVKVEGIAGPERVGESDSWMGEFLWKFGDLRFLWKFVEIYGNLNGNVGETPFFVEVLGEFTTIFVEVLFEKMLGGVILVKKEKMKNKLYTVESEKIGRSVWESICL